MLDTIKEILKNAAIFTFAFFVAFSLLEFYRRPDVITVFEKVFKEKYLRIYIIVFVSAIILQAIIFPIIGFIFS